ncbi:MAG: two-component system, NarL family, response regulator DegU [Candidatus Atribacteria bacterium]|nr:two-component system, NarL family, response regulator DegU [Candidatus Atribacteria bacterium]
MGEKNLSETNSNLKIAIIDDHLLFAEGLKNLLEAKAGFLQCLIFNNAYQALQRLPQENPHLSLVDINLPDMSGIELTRKLLSKNPSMKIVILTMDDSKETILNAITAGAYGYLLKSSSFSNILKDIQAVLQGDIIISAEVAPKIMEEIKRFYHPKQKENSSFLKLLSEREKEVLREIAKGKNNKAIAEELFISEKTVKNHLTNILTKLNIEDRMKLIVAAIKEGILEEEK